MGEVKPFLFTGELAASKSLMNRALIIQSFFSELQIQGASASEDVVLLQKALSDFKQGKQHFDCGSGGTTFRFLLARLSRESGAFTLSGTTRLFERPHDGLYEVLRTLGVRIEQQSNNAVHLESEGWALDQELSMSLQDSSQYVSAILLSAWCLPETLQIRLHGEENSRSYLDMTLNILEQLGMGVEVAKGRLRVGSDSRLTQQSLNVEPDMSSAFALAAFAITKGRLDLLSFPPNPLQPDGNFLSVLDKLGASFSIEGETLSVATAEFLQPISINLQNNPDLFPVLAVLVSRVQGRSTLSGLSVLAHKESDRLSKTTELLRRLGFQVQREADSVSIDGIKDHSYPAAFEFDPDKDHRMAMATALANHQGARVEILDRDVVNKSFPRFWEIVKQ